MRKILKNKELKMEIEVNNNSITKTSAGEIILDPEHIIMHKDPKQVFNKIKLDEKTYTLCHWADQVYFLSSSGDKNIYEFEKIRVRDSEEIA